MEWKTHSTGIVFMYCIFHFILQTLPDSHESYIVVGSTQAELCTSQNWVFIWSTKCVTYKGVHLKSKLQHTAIWSTTVWGPTAWVITRQCSAATFMSLHFHSFKGKFGMQFKRAVLIFIYFFKKQHKLKLHHVGSVCTMFVMEPQINARAKGRCHGST